MITEANRLMGGKWRERLQEKAIKDAKRNDPEVLERRKVVQARQEAERQEQARLTAEAEARRAADMVTFPAMPTKLAAEIIMAFERYRSAGREATAAEIEAVSLLVKGLPLHPGSPQVRLTYGLGMPVSFSGRVDAPAETMSAPKAVAPSKGKPSKAEALTGDGFLIED